MSPASGCVIAALLAIAGLLTLVLCVKLLRAISGRIAAHHPELWERFLDPRVTQPKGAWSFTMFVLLGGHFRVADSRLALLCVLVQLSLWFWLIVGIGGVVYPIVLLVLQSR